MCTKMLLKSKNVCKTVQLFNVESTIFHLIVGNIIFSLSVELARYKLSRKLYIDSKLKYFPGTQSCS